jgi:hypothetical protein
MLLISETEMHKQQNMYSLLTALRKTATVHQDLKMQHSLSLQETSFHILSIWQCHMGGEYEWPPYYSVRYMSVMKQFKKFLNPDDYHFL